MVWCYCICLKLTQGYSSWICLEVSLMCSVSGYRWGVMGRPLEHGRPPENYFLGTSWSSDTRALEKVLCTGFHESTNRAELKDLFNKTSAVLNGTRLSCLCNWLFDFFSDLHGPHRGLTWIALLFAKITVVCVMLHIIITLHNALLLNRPVLIL